eukprot:g12966.t1
MPQEKKRAGKTTHPHFSTHHNLVSKLEAKRHFGLSKKMHITCIALPARAGPPSPENCTHKSAGPSGNFTFGCTGDNEK